MEKRPDQENRPEPKAQIVEQINACLQVGNYSRALDLLRGAAAEFADDVELSALEKLAQNGIQRNAEAQRLITESQELFAQQKSGEAMQLLRKAYELDEKNSLARSILANALVEHAQSFVESNWLEAEKLTNQALRLNPAHPTAKTIFNLIVERKQNSSVEDWVAHAQKLQSSGDLFAALAWVAEGLAVHPDDAKLLQIQDAIQRDQAARRRQTRRRDMEDLRRMEGEIAGAAEVAAKQALAERIQAMVARYWTDGEILAVANGLLGRLGLEGATAAGSKGAPVIFHVPRTGPAKPAGVEPSESSLKEISQNKFSAAQGAPSQAARISVAGAEVPGATVARSKDPADTVLPSEVSSSVVTPEEIAATPEAERATRSKASMWGWMAAAAIVLVAGIFFFARKHQAEPAANGSVARLDSAPAAAAPAGSAPVMPGPIVSAPVVSAPIVSAPIASGPAESVRAGAGAAGAAPAVSTSHVPSAASPSETSPSGVRAASDTGPGKTARDAQPRAVTSRQEVRGGKVEEAKAISNVQPQPPPRAQAPPRLEAQPRLASLTIQGGAPGTAVLVDQSSVGTIQADGTLTVGTVNPGDHTVELRKERFKSREFKKHFVGGEAISLVAADAALEAVPSELKINFTPADAKVVIVKGTFMTFVNSGVPLNVAAGTYTLTARTAERFTRTSTFEVGAGQSKTLDLALAPNGMSKWDNAGAWKQEKDSYIRKGGDFVLYGVAPAAGTFTFSAMPAKGRSLQWVLNYSDPKNYVLFQVDDDNFYRAVIVNGQKTNEMKVGDKGDKKSFRTVRIRVSATEIVHQIQHGESWTVVDRWTQPGANLSRGKFGFYIPGSDEVAVSGFAHYADLNIR